MDALFSVEFRFSIFRKAAHAVVTKISRDNLRHPYVIAWAVTAALCVMVLFSNLEDENKITFFIIFSSLALLLSLYIKIDHWQWSVVDEVYDGGDFLVVKDQGEEETVLISNIAGVAWMDRTAWAGWLAVPRITLLLAYPGKFGQTIIFTPRDHDTEAVARALQARVRMVARRSAA